MYFIICVRNYNKNRNYANLVMIFLSFYTILEIFFGLLRYNSYVLLFPVRRYKLVGGTICPPHESIQFGIALSEFFEIINGVFRTGKNSYDIIDAEEPLFQFIIKEYTNLIRLK